MKYAIVKEKGRFVRVPAEVGLTAEESETACRRLNEPASARSSARSAKKPAPPVRDGKSPRIIGLRSIPDGFTEVTPPVVYRLTRPLDFANRSYLAGKDVHRVADSKKAAENDNYIWEIRGDDGIGPFVHRFLGSSSTVEAFAVPTPDPAA